MDEGEYSLNCNLINLIQLMLLVICFTGIFSYAVRSYKNIRHKIQENIARNISTQWFQFIEKLLPEDYIIYEKYGIWRYMDRFKIIMMF